MIVELANSALMEIEDADDMPNRDNPVPARIIKSNRCDPHGRRQLTRINSVNVLNEGLWIGGKTITRDFRNEIDTRRTQVHVPTVDDLYTLLAI
jgi:hypothetical protein